MSLSADGCFYDVRNVVRPGGVSARQLSDNIFKLRPDLPVLFTTGCTRNAVVRHGRLDPDVQLVNKPCKQRDLLRKVRELLDRKPAAKA
jgi:two-component system, NtrC family, sensor kinase